MNRLILRCLTGGSGGPGGGGSCTSSWGQICLAYMQIFGRMLAVRGVLQLRVVTKCVVELATASVLLFPVILGEECQP